MAISYGFFDGKYTNNAFDRLYTSGQMSEMFNGVITDGVYLTQSDGLLTVTKTENTDMGLTVSPGKAWFVGTWTINTSDLYLTVSTAESDRTDAVVLEVNKTSAIRANRIIIVQNVESSDDLIHADGVDQYALAYITVKANSTIHDYDIKNVVGTTETPYFAWLLQNLDISEILNKWTDILGRTVIEFISWFTLMQATLGYDDQAYTKLYNAIVTARQEPYIDRILPRVNEFTYTMIATGTSRTYEIAVDYVHIANVRVNGKYYPYSVDGNKITFIDAPASGATITVKLVPDLDLYNLYFEEPES